MQKLERTPTFRRSAADSVRHEVEQQLTDDTDTVDQVSVAAVSTRDYEDGDYDTDLDDDTAGNMSSDVTRVYINTCRKMGLEPIGVVERGLRTRTLQLTHRGLTNNELLSVCNALLENKTVISLNLEGNGITHQGAKYVSLLLRENKRIRSLVLGKNSIGKIGVMSVRAMLLENNTLTSLDLTDNKLTDCESAMLAQILKETRTLKTFRLGHNNLTDAAAERFGPAVGMNTSLREFDLSWNKFRSDGGEALRKGLGMNGTLKILTLTMNGLSSKGARSLGDALLTNCSLTHLDVSANRIHDDGVIALARSLAQNDTLETLVINMNPFTSPGGLALLLAVKGNANSAMETLNMSTIPLLDSVVPVIADIRRHKGRFKCMFGGVITTFKEYVSDYRNEIDFREPITILKQHITQQGLRLIDFFKQLDKDGSGSISRDEFVFGLKELNVPLTTSQLDRLIADMDTNCDGEVDYGELIVADTEYRRALRKKAAAVAEAEVDS